MTIKYKFNKSSEARDCVVESVELYEIKSELLTDGLRLYNPLHAFTLEKWIQGMFDCKFTSQQELRNYINTIQKPIEFIAESSIDDVLMKEWIGEWEYRYFVYNEEIEPDFIEKKLLGGNFVEFRYKNTLNFVEKSASVRSIKTGSPKLNSNWTFKIE